MKRMYDSCRSKEHRLLPPPKKWMQLNVKKVDVETAGNIVKIITLRNTAEVCENNLI